MRPVIETVRGLIRAALRIVGITAFTVVEAAALALWLVGVGDIVAVAVPPTVGVAVLAGGLFVGGVFAYVTVNGARSSKPTLALALLAASKTALWVGWLLVAVQIGGIVGPIAAGVALTVFLVPQHTFENNVLRRTGAFSAVIDRPAARYSVIEAAGGTTCFLLATKGGPLTAALNGTFAVDAVGAELGVASLAPETVLGISILTGALFVAHVFRVQHALRRPTDRQAPARKRTRLSAARQD